MGNGTSSGAQTPNQVGVVVRDRENFPVISKSLLELTTEQLQMRIDELRRAQNLNRNRLIPDPHLEENLEMAQVTHEFAKTAVERRG